MNAKYLLTGIAIVISLSLSAQTQSWQWVKAGGSSSDNQSVQPAECKIAGCDAKGNVYAVGCVNGPNMQFDTFSSAGSYSGTGAGISYLLFSYDCAGNMRWAKQIGDQEGDGPNFGVVTDPSGNTYFAGQFWYGYRGGIVDVSLGDSILIPSPSVVTQPYICLIKYDSSGNLVWFKNLEEDTAYSPYVGSFQTVPFGLRIGSSGNLWMICNLDSGGHTISANLQTYLYGMYNIEIEPDSGNILRGYYICNQPFGDASSIDTYYDLDENENFYMTGTLDILSNDTLVLAHQKISVDSNQPYVKPYIFSLDKNGNFRFIITNKTSCTNGELRACKYDLQASRLITCWLVNNGDVYGNDTFLVNSANMSFGETSSAGFLAIDTSGNILWGKYMTEVTDYAGGFFNYLPISTYGDGIGANGFCTYGGDTVYNVDSSSSQFDYYKTIGQIDQNGNVVATHLVHLGYAGTNLIGYNNIKYGTTDWRGNVYLGGTVTNFFATPADSVVNTDTQSGNFFIAKLGVSDCSCPTPGVQYTQTVHGDTVFFYGSSVNHSDSIRWRLGDGGVSSSDTFFHVYTNHDSTYTVTAIAYSGCGVDSITKLITVTSVGIKAIEPDKTNLYPNPATNSVNLAVSGPATIGMVYANGSSVWQNPVQVNQQGTYVFDMSKYSCAMYYFIVQYTNGKTDVMQVVKE